MTAPRSGDDDRRLALAAEEFVAAAAARARAFDAFDAVEPAEPAAPIGGDPGRITRDGLMPAGAGARTHERRSASGGSATPRSGADGSAAASDGVAGRRRSSLGAPAPLPGRLVGTGEWAAAVRAEAARWHRFGRPAAFVTIGLRHRVADVPVRDDPEAVQRYAIPLGETLRRRTRASDPIVRLDAQRFAVMLLHADARGAAAFASRISGACEPWVRAVPGDLAMDVAWAVPGRGEAFEEIASGLLSALSG